MQKVLLKEFLDSEKSCGFILLVCVALSLLLSNTPIGEVYQGFWQMEVFGHSLVHIINDGLMTLFFLLIGLELERVKILHIKMCVKSVYIDSNVKKHSRKSEGFA